MIAEHAVEDATARRLIDQLLRGRGRGARVLPPARALGPRRAGAVDARPAARRRCAAPPTGSRRRSPGSSGRSAATCSSSRPARPRAARGSASPAPASSSTGSRCSTRRRAGRRRIASRSAYLELAVLVRALEGLPSAVRWQSTSTAARSGPACSTCARTCSAARSTICARSPPDASRLLVELTVVGSINLDLVARVERLPRPGETVPATRVRPLPRRQGREPGGRRGEARRRCGWSAPSATTRSPTRRSPGSAPPASSSTSTHAGDDRHRADPRRRRRREPDRRRAGRERDRRRRRRREGAVLCQLEVPDEVVVAAAAQARVLRAERRARAADRRRARPADRQPARARGRVARQARRRHLRRRGRGAVRGRRARSRAPCRPRSSAVDGTAAGDAFAACLVVSLLEGRDREEALERACAAGAIAASRLGAQPSLPTAAEVDAILAA